MLILGSGIRSILRNGILLTGSNWIETGLRAIYLVAITRYLGAELYGIWAYAAAAYGFAIALTGFGFETLLPIRLGTDRRDAGRVLGASLWLRLALLGVAALALAGFAAVAESRPTAELALLLMVPALLGRGVAMWGRVVYVGYERAGILVRTAAVLRLVEVTAGVTLLAAGGGLIAIIILHATVWVAEAALSLRIIGTRLAPYKVRFDRAEVVDLLRQGAVLGLAAALTNWLLAGPLLLLRWIEGDLARLGQLGLGLQLATLMVASLQPFLSAALPVLGRSVARADPRLASYPAITALVALLIGGVAALLGFLLGEPFVIWAFGPSFGASGSLIGPCLLIGGLIVAPTGYVQLLALRGQRWQGVAASAAGALVLLAALPPAAMHLGLDGAILATTAAWLTRAVTLIGLAILLRHAAAGSKC